MRLKCKRLLLAIMLMSLVANLALPVLAQNPTGAIRGTVTDPQGAIVPNAAVTITNKATGESRKISTGSDGIYAVENLLPGEYEVKVEAQGFSTQVITAMVQVGNTTTGDAALRVGTKEEIVEVQAEAPQIDKSNFKIDGVIGRQKIDALPLNGRNFLQLALLEPGVGVTTKNPGSQNNLFNVSIGGANSALTRLTVDGGSILDPVCGGAAQNFSTETIQEFQISTFNFDLSTGVTSVGARLPRTSRSQPVDVRVSRTATAPGWGGSETRIAALSAGPPGWRRRCATASGAVWAANPERARSATMPAGSLRVGVAASPWS